MALDNKIFKQYLPDKNLALSEEHIAEFFYTMYQRQEIWYNRNILKTSRPWCDDNILNQYKFCNAYRELDKQSQWVIHNIIRIDDELINKIWKICVFRLFNTLEVFEIIDIPNHDEYDSKEFTSYIKEVEKYFPACNKKAYAINSWLAQGTSQAIACANIIMPSLHKVIGDIMFHGFIGNSKINDIVKLFTSCEGLGKFVTHEYFIDMCYIAKYTDNNDFGFDENSWTNVGEGAKNGLRLLTPSMSYNISTLRMLQDLSKELLPDDFKYIQWNKIKNSYELCDWNITLTNIEFWTCEYQKYWKIKHKIGKQRDKFKLSV